MQRFPPAAEGLSAVPGQAPVDGPPTGITLRAGAVASGIWNEIEVSGEISPGFTCPALSTYPISVCPEASGPASPVAFAALAALVALVALVALGTAPNVD